MYNFLEWEGQVWYYQAKFGVINSRIVQNVKDKKIYYELCILTETKI